MKLNKTVKYQYKLTPTGEVYSTNSYSMTPWESYFVYGKAHTHYKVDILLPFQGHSTILPSFADSNSEPGAKSPFYDIIISQKKELRFYKKNRNGFETYIKVQSAPFKAFK